jgi:cytochrome c553
MTAPLSVEVRMFRNSHSSAYALLLVLLAFVVACGSSQPPAEPAKPAEPPKPVVEIKPDMHDHLSRVTTIQEAVIRGDLEAVAEPATWIVNHEQAPLPASTETYAPDIKKTAGMAAGAKDLASAAIATSQLVAACGACHQAAKTPIAWPAQTKPVEGAGIVAHMLEHQWAVDLMYQGLAQPSDEAWKQGVEALKASPLAAKDLPKDQKLTKDIVAYEKKVHELAAKALIATDLGSKVAVYGEALASCASCHGLHGKVWGPGLPKAPQGK